LVVSAFQGQELAGLKNLQTLFLNNTRVTDEGLAELRKALPALVVYMNY
jgi:hypothetical protein